MKPLIPLLFLLAVLALATAGCIQPPAPLTENETGFNISAVERDHVREAAAEAVHFPKNITELDDLDLMLPENQAYYQYMKETPNADYYGFLVTYYPDSYRYYQNLSLNMSYIEFLERCLTTYPYDLNHATSYVPLKFHEISGSEIDASLPIIHLTNETVNSTPLLRFYFIDTNHAGLKVLPGEEWQLVPYKDAQDTIRKAYIEWNNTYYWMNRAIA
ncbi:MAG: hypothetical protein O0X93_09845 [Methanocorpusculum sp.]|nr:hypothetical protein [Methanocorpusculum sp.]MDE2523436.1 hypothetical protein [Methanocorpusculum sp.]MDE2523570.1 hypothetical protein [Methanocorpusculum sp.]